MAGTPRANARQPTCLPPTVALGHRGPGVAVRTGPVIGTRGPGDSIAGRTRKADVNPEGFSNDRRCDIARIRQ
jgi:hypothetical protein